MIPGGKGSASKKHQRALGEPDFSFPPHMVSSQQHKAAGCRASDTFWPPEELQRRAHDPPYRQRHILVIFKQHFKRKGQDDTDSFEGRQHSSIYVEETGRVLWNRETLMPPIVSKGILKTPPHSAIQPNSSQPATCCLRSSLRSPRKRPHLAVRGKQRQARPNLESLEQESSSLRPSGT